MPNELSTLSDESAVPDDLSDYLRAENIVASINANLPSGLNSLPPIPVDYAFKRRDKEVVAIALHAAFQLRGALPALVAWADREPDKFYAMWAKLLNDENLNSGGTTINFMSNIPASPLDMVNVSPTGKVFNIDGFEDDAELPE